MKKKPPNARSKKQKRPKLSVPAHKQIQPNSRHLRQAQQLQSLTGKRVQAHLAIAKVTVNANVLVLLTSQKPAPAQMHPHATRNTRQATIPSPAPKASSRSAVQVVTPTPVVYLTPLAASRKNIITTAETLPMCRALDLLPHQLNSRQSTSMKLRRPLRCEKSFLPMLTGSLWASS